MTNLIISSLPVDSELFSSETYAMLEALAPELNKAFATKQIFRTETEARVSVLDKIHFPTKASKYWQSIREQTSMLESLASLSFDYRRNEVAIKRLEKTLANLDLDELDIEEAQINLEEKLFGRANMKIIAADRAREIKMWSMLKAEQDDGSFDTNNVDTHQLVSYATQFAMMVSTVNPSSMSSSEVVNLIGQLQTTLDRCRDLGVLEQVINNLPSQVSSQLQLTTPL